MPDVLDRSIRSRISDEQWKLTNGTDVAPSRSTLCGTHERLRTARIRIPNGQIEFTYSDRVPVWFQEVIASLAQLAWLPANWNSYQAIQIRPICLSAAIRVLLDVTRIDTPKPSVVPTVRGTVQLEWHTRGVDLEVEILGPSRLLASFEDTKTGEDWEAAVGADLTRLVECVNRLT